MAIQPGEGGAAEWQGNFYGFDCSGQPCFLYFVDANIGLHLISNGSCAVGGDVLWTAAHLEVVSQHALSPIPTAYFPVPAGCEAVPDANRYAHWEMIAGGTLSTFKIRFRLSSRDMVTGDYWPDGYIETTWGGSSFGTYRWDGLTLSGLTWSKVQWLPGQWTDRIYVRHTDVYCGWNPAASDLYYYRDFTATPGTPEELFSEFGGMFERRTHGLGCGTSSAPLAGYPRIDELGRPSYTSATNVMHCFAALRRVTPWPPYVPPDVPPPTPVCATASCLSGLPGGTSACAEEPV